MHMNVQAVKRWQSAHEHINRSIKTMFARAHCCNNCKQGNSHDQSNQMMISIVMMFARANNKKIQRRWGSPEEKNTNNNQLADDCYHVFFNRNKDCVDDSSVRLKTQQSAKLASWLGEWLPWGPNNTTECLCACGFCEMLQSLKKTLQPTPSAHLQQCGCLFVLADNY